MGLSVDSTTLETFLFYGLLFCVTMGYYVYRLSSKILDHVIHTREVDQYVSHFENNQDVFEAVGSGLMNFGNDIINKIYTFNCVRYGCDSAKSFLGPLARFFFTNQAATNSHTFYTGLADRFCNLVKKVTAPKPTTQSRCPVLRDTARRTDRMCPVVMPVDFDFVCVPEAPAPAEVPATSETVSPWHNSTIFSDSPAPPKDYSVLYTGSNLTPDQARENINAGIDEFNGELFLYGAPSYIIEKLEKAKALDFSNVEQLTQDLTTLLSLSPEQMTESNEWVHKYAANESNPHPLRKAIAYACAVQNHMSNRDDFLKYIETYMGLLHECALFILKKRNMDTSHLERESKEEQIRKVMEELRTNESFNATLDMFFPINPPSIEEQMLKCFRVLENPTVVNTTPADCTDVPLTMGGEGGPQTDCWCKPDCCGPDGIPCGSVPCPCGPSVVNPTPTSNPSFDPEESRRLFRCPSDCNGCPVDVIVTDEGVVITEDH